MNILTNPVLTKELRGRIRGARATVILTIYLTLIGAVTLLIYLAIANPFADNQPNLESGRNIGKVVFLTVMTVALVQVCIIVPALTAGSIAGEKERQSFDLLVMTALSPWQIVLGKLAAALAYALLLITSALPLAGLAFLFGGVSGTELVIGVIGLLVSAVLYATIGLFWSTMMRTTLAATVMSQATIITSLLGIPFLFAITGIFFSSSQGLRDLMENPATIYIGGAILCLHPFIALGMTEAQIVSQGNIFFDTIRPFSNDVVVPSPWIAFTCLSILLTIIFLIFTTRALRIKK